MGGWTPLPDDLAKELGLIPAIVYARVSRFCQMTTGKCNASLETIGDGLGINRMTVCNNLAILVKLGYLSKTESTTVRVPNIYSITDKYNIYATVTGTEIDKETGEETNTRTTKIDCKSGVCKSGVCKSGVPKCKSGVPKRDVNKQGTVAKVSDETFAPHGVESPTRVPQPPPPIGSTTSGFSLPVYPAAKEVKAAQLKGKRIAEKTVSARLLTWEDGLLLKVQDYVHAYNRGIAVDGKVVGPPDHAALERYRPFVEELDVAKYTPQDFEDAARYYYRTWNGKVSIKSLVGLLSEWDARGRPKIKRIFSVLPSDKKVETYGEMKMREYEEALREEAQIASMAVH